MQQGQSVKIFLACALGAGIGSLVALEIAAAFWWVGVILGGLVGYLSYEWRAVCSAVPRAWKDATGWRSPPTFWRDVGGMYAILACICSWILPPAIMGLRVLSSELDPPFVVGLVATTSVAVAAIVLYFCVGLLIIWPILVLVSPDLMTETPARTILYRGFSPIVLLWHLPRNAKIITVTLGRFCRELFLRIHSEQRLICGVDSLLGALIGYFVDSVIVGLLAGGVLGLINYQLVTLRWLVPRGYVTIKK